MKLPKMILFDYGSTLLCESGFDMLRGERAVFAHVTDNPRGATPEDANALSNELYDRHAPCRALNIEIPEQPSLRLKYEYLGVRLDVSIAEAEQILWDGAAEGGPMPHVEEMLEYIAARGIRSGVVSNIGWSGAALSARINRLLPQNRFEFVIASSDYGLRKPDRLLFELALRKTGLDGGDVWYCGDRIVPDVYGPQSVGIFPVFYDDKTVFHPFSGSNDGLRIAGEYLHIADWRELVEALKGLE